MCLIGVGIGIDARYPVVVAANRDEMHARETQSAHRWQDFPQVLAGRDRVGGGTWLGLDRTGRIAAVTNLHGRRRHDDKESRGTLVKEYLATGVSAERYASEVANSRSRYNGFNLLVIGGLALHYVNSEGALRQLGAGTHALSNAPLGDDWRKTTRMRWAIEAALATADPVTSLLEFLQEDRAPTAMERFRETVFISGESFGTRASTVILLAADGEFVFVERRFDAQASATGQTGFRGRIRSAP